MYVRYICVHMLVFVYVHERAGQAGHKIDRLTGAVDSRFSFNVLSSNINLYRLTIHWAV